MTYNLVQSMDFTPTHITHYPPITLSQSLLYSPILSCSHQHSSHYKPHNGVEIHRELVLLDLLLDPGAHILW